LRDHDGSNPAWGDHWRRVVMQEMPSVREGTERQIEWLERVAQRLRRYVDSRKPRKAAPA
jgi:hypothetical protein